MYNKKVFLEKIINLNYFDVDYNPDLSQNNCIKFNNIDEFSRYLKINNIKSVFVHFGYYNPNEYIVTKDDFDEKYHKHLDLLRSGLKTRNSYADRLNSEPNSVITFFNFGGYIIYYTESDPWLDEYYILPKSEFIEKALLILDEAIEN